MNVNHAIDLNVSATGMPPVLKMAQYDANSRTIVATLWNGASKFVIPSDASVMVRFGKPDGTGGLYDETEAGDAITFADNVVTAPVAAQMLSVAGKVQADIEIYQTGDTEQAAVKLATFCFVVNVERAAYQDADMISSDYYNIIAGQIQQAILAGVKADAAIAARDQAVAAATSAERSRDNANQYAKKAIIAADSAEDAQNGAIAAKTAAEDAQNDAVAAKTAAEDAQNAAEVAQQSAEELTSNAAQNAEDAEAWAVGKRNGVDVNTDDPAYHNNARYYKDQAQGIAGGGVISFNGRSGSVKPQAGDYTKGMVGLGDVDNTADIDKPVSTAQQNALNAKQPKITASGILKGNGSGGVSAAVKGTDYAAPSRSVALTLPAAYWSDGVFVIGIADSTDALIWSAGSNGSLRISQTATDEQFAAWCAAQPRVTAQGDNTITIKAAGTVPIIDIPVEVLIV